MTQPFSSTSPSLQPQGDLRGANSPSLSDGEFQALSDACFASQHLHLKAQGDI